MTQQYLKIVKKYILDELADENVSIALFGSFADSMNTSISDIDIAVIPKEKLKKWKLSLLREKLEELTIPYSIDLVDFSMVSERFKKIALANALWWRK
ncbi:MAG: nucleotidyltransferase domain-containing protein [Ignavibacteriae bacterium]|nr:nucleotidyltransferase domain-containing protein [Ignavibacteriota bacterium]